MAKKGLLFGAVLGFAGRVSGECANACSGHGECGTRDECRCYQNYQGNDCSERTCYFGMAHVDTPKGDLNHDGVISGSMVTVLTGSEVYPWGTTEQYPNANAHEGHFYAECSNKGLCDRKTGVCDCFDGFGGSACARATCPNDCSGHGTCESIKELAEMRGYDFTGHDVVTARTPSGTSGTDYDPVIQESYSYDLWDADKTMGCKCDPGYHGADCSMRKCKYGVDPQFWGSAAYQSTVVHLGSAGTGRTDLAGTFKIIFFDIFGEKYATKAIDAAPATASAAKVQQALEALPNGVVSKANPDVTSAQPAAVGVSMQAKSASANPDTSGQIGGGEAGELGAGVGVRGHQGRNFGPEFTITFTSNPGVLRAIEVDTREVINHGTNDYWVANQRQGEFRSRYTQLLGTVQGFKYGSTLLYTNSDLTTSTPANTMVKVGLQEFRVVTAHRSMLTLSEAFLGASIVPTLRDTGARVTGFYHGHLEAPALAQTDRMVIAMPAKSAQRDIALSVIRSTGSAGSAATANGEIWAGTASGGCAFLTDYHWDSKTADMTATTTKLYVLNNHGCYSDNVVLASPAQSAVYKRTADSQSLNLYKTTGDTGAATVSLMVKRGSNVVYTVTAAEVSSGVQAYVKQYTTIGTKYTVHTAMGSAITTGTNIWVNGHGPTLTTSTCATGALNLIATGAEPLALFGSDFTGVKFALVKAAANSAISATSILALNGRRYRVRAISTAGNGGKIELAENYAGGSLVQLCASCVTDVTADGLHLTTNKKVQTTLGDKLLVGGYAHEDLAVTVTSSSTESSAGRTHFSHKTSPGTNYGDQTTVKQVSGTPTAVSSGTGHLYKVVNGGALGFTGSIITEGAASVEYQYVGQCSNRGHCDGETGVCNCYAGFAGDNCDSFNAMSM